MGRTTVLLRLDEPSDGPLPPFRVSLSESGLEKLWQQVKGCSLHLNSLSVDQDENNYRKFG